MRIKERSAPSSSTFDEYLETRTSCWIVEERNGDYFCDCPIGMKGKMCFHTSGMQYKEGHLEPISDVRAVPLGAKRRKGRPKKLPASCLASSPVPLRKPMDILEVDDEASDSHVTLDDAPVKKTTRRKRNVFLTISRFFLVLWTAHPLTITTKYPSSPPREVKSAKNCLKWREI
jgi:hypothetical protein